MSLVFDFDNIDGALTPEDIQRCLAAGMQGAIVGLQYPNAPYPPGVAHQQLEALITAGVPIVACYAMSQHVSQVWAHVERFKAHIPQVFVDVEEAWVDRTYIDSSLGFIDALGLEKRAGIYTARWFWDTQEYAHWFGDRDLWAAEYDGNPDCDRFTAFGDWTRCTIKQWSGNAWIGRLNLDLNSTREWGQ